ncbi:MAG: hypothetical protein ACREH9_12750, partial [Pseudomonadota bacterium]
MIPAWVAFYDGLIAITLFLVGILGAYFHVLPSLTGFGIAMGGGTLVSILGIVIGIVAMFRTRAPQRAAGRPRAQVGLILSLIVFIPVLVLFLSGLKYPGINDITTDFTNPPEFTHAQELAQNHGRDMKYNQAKYAAIQRKGYPPLAPLHLNDSPPAAFERVGQLAASMPTWVITSTDPAT